MVFVVITQRRHQTTNPPHTQAPHPKLVGAIETLDGLNLRLRFLRMVEVRMRCTMGGSTPIASRKLSRSLDRYSTTNKYSRFMALKNTQEKSSHASLGARGYLPSGYIVSSL
jgi:hypothetical protein